MKLRIVTPVRPVVDAEVTELVAPGTEGEFGVLAEHVTFLGSLKPGVVSYTEGGVKKRIVISGGYAEVRQDMVTLLADDAQLPEEVDAAQARVEVTGLLDELARGNESPEVTEKLLRDLALAEARVAVGAR
jgi:F-type H+-transporting ATPase subunit epsilon